MFTLSGEVLEISYFCAVSTQVVHTSSSSPNFSFPLIHPNHPLAGKKENKMAKIVEKKKKGIWASWFSERFSMFLEGKGLHLDK